MTRAEAEGTPGTHLKVKATARVARLLRHAPSALTAARPLIGAASGLEVLADNGPAAAWLYLAGYGSDVADGFLSRALKAESDFGAALDRWADLVFHGAVGLGLAVAATRRGSWSLLVILCVLLVGERLARRWIAARSVLGRALGGAYRILMFGLILAFCDPEQYPVLIEAGLTVIVITYVYEAFITLRELRTGQRPFR